ncbi:hypothetical protein E4K65_14630 [Bradyrhizobium niftali]|uniref:Uncharacterized protein n=1 Tax=Bradyrhizobium niftali TaxID=2560055 RepID=A0A4Y9LYQ9_9BRAD|nr:hypothetical protein E4K65_14630 [Bradyrhizobium niftali]
MRRSVQSLALMIQESLKRDPHLWVGRDYVVEAPHPVASIGLLPAELEPPNRSSSAIRAATKLWLRLMWWCRTVLSHCSVLTRSTSS